MDIPPPSDGTTEETYHRGRDRNQAAVGLVVGLGVVCAFVRWKPFRVEISGPSMAPTLLPGDWALAVKPGRPHRGDVVVVEHPQRPGVEIVKRIVAGPGDLAPDGAILEPDTWWVQGDSPAESTDSRHFGPVSTAGIRAKVRLVYWPPAHRRRV